ncbi:MAG: hypothetical protein N3D85_02515 [Candidatus Bathyarchaeota archaeon]|nr:hypothetical protein [Candidatus Bathyarchaeota archaeon]
MNLYHAVAYTLKSKRFWIWQGGGIILYCIPVAIRFTTGSYYIPILSWPGFWVYHLIPGNLVEKFLINAFFPGGAGAVAGEVFVSNYYGSQLQGKTKYEARLAGALAQTAFWSAIQYFGYSLMWIGPFGGNIFEPWYVFPFNFSLGCLSIFTPDVVYFVRQKLIGVYNRLQRNLTSKS